MSDLISRVRLLIADTGSPSQFQDQDVQDVLDLGRVVVRTALLRPTITLDTNGAANYADYYADVENWESGATIQNGAFAIISDYTADYLTGHWSFSLPNPGQVPPLFITGQYYDIYGAAADLLERWAAAWARSYNFTSDGQSFQRSQAAQMMLTQSKQYRKQSFARTVSMVRDDLSGDRSSINVVAGATDVFGW